MDESKAHDQETQTNFDVNPRERREPSLHGTPSLDRRYRYNQRHSQPWPAAGHPYYRNPYPDYYPYDMPYPPPPPPPSLPAALHGSSHYYPGRTPHWHNPPSPVPPHLSQIPRAHSTFPHYLYNHMDGYYPHHPPTRGVAPASAISHRRHSEIARPKAEWPPGYQPHVKPNVPSDYLATFCGNVGSEYGGPPSTATSLKSTVIDLPHSNFSSPRPSARISRKRALSNTPSSVESIDLNALIRGSPDSLLGYLGPARVSSAGSFGHLSPIGFCTSPVSRQAPHYPTVRNLFITPPPIPPLRLPTPSSTRDTVPSSTTGAEGIKEEVKEEPMSHSQSPPASSIKEPEGSHSRDESMEVCHLDSTTSPGTSEVKAGSDNEAEEGHAEQEEQDLNCHWKECPTQFESQEALVNHVNSDHIKRERKDFTCYWDGCNREKKPFKAQYMLVVHMRRHTGEKPHKCTYEGCIKAYSRLENLKTHLRSHTGERPYVCEVEGCNKAFSNASDRAKHQNRTHSSVKPYVCKVPGCPKRYTDPSSLRKHTKTVHGEQGIKRLKAEGSREKPPSNPDKKGSSTPEKGPTPQDSNSAAQSTSYAVSTQLQEPKSPATNGSSVVGGSCSQTFAGSCCEGDTISSSCDRTPGGLDIPSSQDSPHSIGNSTLGVSPRSPPFVNHLPDILEGDWEPAESGAMTTVQSIVNMPQPQSVTLPKIDNHKRDVAQWVNDVHRRMSETSRRSSEGSHLSVEMAADMSRRSSQESGWSSYNGSRRSSQASPFPTTSLQRSPQEMTSRPLNAPVVPQLVVAPQCRPYLHPLDGSEDFFRRQSETSTCSNLSAPYNRLSRNSSGYGSQSNLAVIRSPMFHKIPPSSHFSPQRSICADAVNRRKSDTIVCEADSSGRYLPKNGKGELRRSSEPVGQVRGLARLEPSSGNVNREVTPMENLNETELISDDFDPNELDAYLSPQREGQMDSNSSGNQVVPAPVPRQTQRLCHYPYPEDQQSYPQQPPSQTVHHRPHPGYHSQADHGQQTCEEQVLRGNPVASLNDAEVPRMIPEGYWPQHGFRTEQQSAFYQQGCPTSENGVYNTAMHPPGQKGCTDMGNYEDAMVTGIGLLSTNSNGGVSEFVGNGNMVVNDMNTLLTSLLEEEKYLELRQNSRGVAGSAMSIF